MQHTPRDLDGQPYGIDLCTMNGLRTQRGHLDDGRSQSLDGPANVSLQAFSGRGFARAQSRVECFPRLFLHL